MKRLLNSLGISATFGLTVGVAVGLARIHQERYVALGLHGLALSVLTGSLEPAIGVAVTAAAGAQLLRILLLRAIDSLGVVHSGARRVVTPTLGLAVFLCSTWPVWLWLRSSHLNLIQAPSGLGREAQIGFLLAHVPVYFAARTWGRCLAPKAGVGLAAGALTLLCLAPLSLLDRIGALDSATVKTRPNVLIVVMDTVRADRLSIYGYDRPTTPELDDFAGEAIRFSRFFSTSSWTVPSHASIFTGLYPIQHGAHQENLNLRPEFATLAEILRNAGYQTFGASQNPYVSSRINLTQGFQEFDDLWRRWRKPNGSVTYVDSVTHPVNTAFEGFLARSDRQRPFFVFLNYINAHLPTAPPEPFLSRFQREGTKPEDALHVGLEDWTRYYVGKRATPSDLRILSDLYDGELAYISYSIGALLSTLREDGRYDDTLIIITSDHGEQFGEHGHLGHMFSLYNTAVRVPLLIRPPGGVRPGRVDDRPSQVVDLLPTILDATGTPFEAGTPDGVNLLASREVAGRDVVLSEYYYPAQVMELFSAEDLEREGARLAPYRRRLRAIEADGKRLIWSSTGDHELYDLTKDPAENRNLYSSEPELAEKLLTRMESIVKAYGGTQSMTAGGGAPTILDEETSDALRTLGYVR